MHEFLDLVLSGIVTGGIFAIVASGLVLTYQTTGIFNFSQGAIAFTVAYFYYQLNTGLHISAAISAVLSLFVLAPLLGLLLDRLLFRNLMTAPVYAQIVGTIGVYIALPALVKLIIDGFINGTLGLGIPSTTNGGYGLAAPGFGPHPPTVYHLIGGLNLNSDQLAVFAASIFAAVGLWVVIRRTRIGLEMRATVDKVELASLRGIEPGRVSATAWVLSVMLAGLGGLLIAPLFTLDDSIFTLVVFGSLGALALSRLQSIPIAFVGGLLIGVAQNLLAGYRATRSSFLGSVAGISTALPYVITLVLWYIWVALALDRPERRQMSRRGRITGRYVSYKA